MEFLFDILVEAFFEIFGEGFIALCSAFIPQKVASKKKKKDYRLCMFSHFAHPISWIICRNNHFGGNKRTKFLGLAIYFFEHNLFTCRNYTENYFSY